MGWSVREAGPGDVAAIVEFNCRLAEETEGKALDTALLERGVARALADSSKIRYFLVEDNGQVVAQMGLTYEWSDWRDGWFWWIQSVYVRPAYRRRGVFRALFHHVEQAARHDPQVIGLRLFVEKANTPAQNTYLSLGMLETGYVVLEKYPLEPSQARENTA